MATEKTGVASHHEAPAFNDDGRNQIESAGTAIQLSHEVDEVRYKPFTKSMFRLYGVLFIAYLCGCLNGYDGSLMGGLNGMETYLKYFGM